MSVAREQADALAIASMEARIAELEARIVEFDRHRKDCARFLADAQRNREHLREGLREIADSNYMHRADGYFAVRGIARRYLDDDAA